MVSKKSIKPLLILLAVSTGIIVLLAMWFQSQNPSASATAVDTEEVEFEGPLSAEVLAERNQEPSDIMNPTAIITTNLGTISLELFETKMPITVGNFVTLVEDGFYDQTKFHRIIDGFMIQGGDPNSKGDEPSTYGRGGPGYTIQDEFVSDPLLTNVRGTIAMANTGQPDSGGSQFFINTVDNSNLDFDKPPLSSKHPVFGRVVEGMDVIDAISAVATGPGDVPVEPVVLESVTIQRQ